MLYPIFDLTRYEKSLRWYVTALEEVIIQTVAKFGIQAHRSTVNNGVWVSDSIYCITVHAIHCCLFLSVFLFTPIGRK